MSIAGSPPLAEPRRVPVLGSPSALAGDEARLLRELLDTCTELVCAATPDGRLTYVNQAWQRTFGYTAEEAAALAAPDLVALEDRGRYVEMGRRLVAGETIEEFEAVLVAKGGRRVVCRGRAVPVMVDDPEVPGRRLCVATRAAYRDVTADRRGEVMRARLAKTLEATPDFVGLSGHDGRILYLNDAGRRMVGIAPSDDLSTVLAPHLHPPETIELFMREAFPAVERGETWMGEGELLSLAGERIPVSMVIVPHPAIGGADDVPRFTAVMRDLRDRKRAEAVLAARERELQTLLGALADVVVVLDADGTFLRAVPACRDLYVAPPETLIGRRVHDALPVDVADAVLAAVHAALASGEPASLEYALDVPRGRTWFSATGSPLSDGTVLWVARDVTARREAEEQLRQAQKMEALGQFAGSMAHDFNNFLMVIRGNADAVLSALPARDPGRDAVDDIIAAADRAAGLTRQILAFSRRQVLRPARVALSAAVPAILRMLEQAVGPQVHVETRLSPDAGDIRADATQISQLLLNLAVNARDAMSDGGTLTIETAAATLARGVSHAHGVVPAGSYSVLTVRDTGVGMSEATLARIFEPFFTTKSRGRGTGLGLATVYGIVQQSGGHVTVASRPGAGTTFTLYFPHLPAEAAPPDADAAGPAGVGGDRVLVVDDEPAVLRATRRILEQAGFTVSTASDGESALAVLTGFAARGTLPDVVLTDVQMPGLSGRELGHRIAASYPDLPVLYMSGYTTDDVLSQQLGREAQRIIAKPFTGEALLAAVESRLRTA